MPYFDRYSPMGPSQARALEEVAGDRRARQQRLAQESWFSVLLWFLLKMAAISAAALIAIWVLSLFTGAN